LANQSIGSSFALDSYDIFDNGRAGRIGGRKASSGWSLWFVHGFPLRKWNLDL
jgi:hypothetical protein